MSRHSVEVLTGVAVALTLTACGISRTNATPVADRTSTTSSAVYPSTLLPPRTRDLDLTGVDPCTDLLTGAQLHELDYDVGYDHPPLPDHSDFHGGPSCSFGSSRPLDGHPIRNIGALVAISTTEGADAWLTDPNRAGAELASSATIEGFPSLVLPHPVLRDDCMVVVDTADKQYIEVSVGPDTGRDTVRKPYCDEAKRVSAMAIRTLTGRGEK